MAQDATGERQDAFFSAIGDRNPIEDADTTIASIGRFLGLADPAPMRDFLRAQRSAPTPTTDNALLALAEKAATQLGYSASETLSESR